MGNIHLEISSDIEGATPISAEPADKERLYKMSKRRTVFQFFFNYRFLFITVIEFLFIII